MREFFTSLTLEASVWCKPCGKKTQWKITGGQPQYCLTCFDKLEEQHAKKLQGPQAPVQEGFNFK